MNKVDRSREDRLPVALVDTVEGWLENSQADELADCSHAFLAHAGSVKSREELKQAIVTNNKITEAVTITYAGFGPAKILARELVTLSQAVVID